MYIYPDNLRAKATLWLWQLRSMPFYRYALRTQVFWILSVMPVPFLLGNSKFMNGGTPNEQKRKK